MSYYTRKGDDGTSGLLGEWRPSKNNPVFHAVGDIDELNSAIGVSLYYTHDDRVRSRLRQVQNELFSIGANLASAKKRIRQAELETGAVRDLEDAIEDMGRRLPTLKKFVIPGGCEASVHLHLARAIARRAERSMVAVSKKRRIDKVVMSYMNRLSSYLFVAALYLDYIEGVKESHPAYQRER